MRCAFEKQAHGGRIAWIAHDVGQTARIHGQAYAHRHVENFLSQFDHALHGRGAAGEHHAGGKEFLEPGFAQHFLHERKQLLDARLYHFGQRLARHHAGRSLADTGHLHHFVRVSQLAQRNAVADLDGFRIRRRRAQGHRNVIGDLVARDRDDRRVADRTMREDRDVGGAAADIDKAHAQVLLVLGEDRARRGQRLEDQVVDFQPAAAHALHDVLRRRHRAGHDVNLYFQPHAGHADRLAHVLLAVDDVLLPQHVQDLLVGGNVHRARGFDHPFHIERGDFPVLDCDHAGRVEAPDVAAGDAGENRSDLAVGHQLGFFQGALDRADRRFDVDDDTFLKALGLVAAHAENLESPVGPDLRDQRHHFRGADVQADDEFLGFLCHVSGQPFAFAVPARSNSGTRRAKPFG